MRIINIVNYLYLSLYRIFLKYHPYNNKKIILQQDIHRCMTKKKVESQRERDVITFWWKLKKLSWSWCVPVHIAYKVCNRKRT